MLTTSAAEPAHLPRERVLEKFLLLVGQLKQRCHGFDKLSRFHLSTSEKFYYHMFQIAKIHFIHDDRPTAGFLGAVLIGVGISGDAIVTNMATITTVVTTSVTNGTVLLFGSSRFLFFPRVGPFVDVIGIFGMW